MRRQLSILPWSLLLVTVLSVGCSDGSKNAQSQAPNSGYQMNQPPRAMIVRVAPNGQRDYATYNGTIEESSFASLASDSRLVWMPSQNTQDINGQYGQPQQIQFVNGANNFQVPSQQVQQQVQQYYQQPQFQQRQGFPTSYMVDPGYGVPGYGNPPGPAGGPGAGYPGYGYPGYVNPPGPAGGPGVGWGTAAGCGAGYGFAGYGGYGSYCHHYPPNYYNYGAYPYVPAYHFNQNYWYYQPVGVYSQYYYSYYYFNCWWI